MAWRNDVAGFLRGLESITKALIEHQRHEFQKTWSNSSVQAAIASRKAASPEKLQVCEKSHT